jgi:hypothetical protein
VTPCEPPENYKRLHQRRSAIKLVAKRELNIIKRTKPGARQNPENEENYQVFKPSSKEAIDGLNQDYSKSWELRKRKIVDLW